MSPNGNIFRYTGPLWGESNDEFPSQRPVTRSFDVSINLRLNKRLSKQSRRRWFETLSRSLSRQYNASNYLNQMRTYCQLDPKSICQWNPNKNETLFFQENSLEIMVRRIAAIVPRTVCWYNTTQGCYKSHGLSLSCTRYKRPIILMDFIVRDAYFLLRRNIVRAAAF